MFLTKDEIEALTGKKQKEAQRKALRALGYTFRDRADGSPVVLRCAKPRPLEVCDPSGLLTEAQIVQRAESVVRTRAVYFLLHGTTIVYVGQTNNVHKRIGEHLIDAGKTFDAYSFIKVSEAEAPLIEAAYIRKFRPKFNVQWNCSVPEIA